MNAVRKTRCLHCGLSEPLWKDCAKEACPVREASADDYVQRGGLTEQETPSALPAHDSVNHPAHYTAHPSGVECITITEHMNFCRGNALKYLWRAGSKGEGTSELEDLRKARWYLDREIVRLEAAK